MAAIRVLLVEDEGVIRMMTTIALQNEGFEVVEARDGTEAAGLLDGSDAFDVLFTDVQMPGQLDGIDLAVYARRQHPALPVLVVSGYGTNLANRMRALNPPAAFIGKPYYYAEIVDVLRMLAAGP